MSTLFHHWHGLLGAAKRGDAAAADQITRLLMGWARQQMKYRRTQEVEDVIGMFVIYLTRDQFRYLPDLEVVLLPGFFKKCLHRFQIDLWRRERDRQCYEIPWPQFSDGEVLEAVAVQEDPLSLLLLKENVYRIESALLRLSEENRNLILLWVEGHSQSDLAARSGLGVNTLKQRLHSIRQQIRNQVDDPRG